MDYRFHADLADYACAWIERRLRHFEGEWAGKPLTLHPTQRHHTREIFGWRRPDGTRRYRTIGFWVPRKNAKTTFGLALQAASFFCENEPAAQGFVIGSKKEQAQHVFDKWRFLLLSADGLARPDVAQIGKSFVLRPDNFASFKPLTGNAHGKQGLSVSHLLGDEVHEWPSGRLYDFLHQSEGARRQPFEVLASTAGLVGSYAEQLYRYHRDVADGAIADDEVYPIIYAAGPDDDWEDPATWAKANPLLGVSVKPDFLARECLRARQLGLQNDFRRFYLNQWVGQASRWIDLKEWDSCSGAVPWNRLEETLAGRRCFGGADLSATRDLTALCLFFPPTATQPAAAIWRIWVPQATFEARAAGPIAGRWRRWAEDGAVVRTAGNAVDYAEVQRVVADLDKRFRPAAWGFDPHNAEQMVQELNAGGLNVHFVRQGFLSLNTPTKTVDILVGERRLHHGGHPVLRWVMDNVSVLTDPAGSKKIDKAAAERSHAKIDPLAALINAIAAWQRAEAREIVTGREAGGLV